MKNTVALAAIVAAAALAAPAFAQTHVQSSSSGVVSSGSGVLVTPGAPAVTTHVVPAGSVTGVTSTHVVGAGPLPSTTNATTTTTITRYWVNVPANVERNASFQRWQRLQ